MKYEYIINYRYIVFFTHTYLYYIYIDIHPPNQPMFPNHNRCQALPVQRKCFARTLLKIGIQCQRKSRNMDFRYLRRFDRDFIN